MKRVILVTGASSGMGKDGAMRLIREGHIVYGAARRITQMQDLCQSGGYAIEMDVTCPESVKAAVNRIVREQGRIDILWNNAGYSVAGAVEDVSAADAKRQFEVNLFGIAEVTKAVLPHMRKQGSGMIINTSSVGGKVFTPLNAWYHASKFALEGWSDCLRLELAPFNIKVVVLEPGGVKTAFGDTMYQPLLERAQGGAYEEYTAKIVHAYKNYYSPENTALAAPSVISDTLVNIVNSKRPRTRYAAGYMAKTALFMRWLLSDRLFERIIKSQY